MELVIKNREQEDIEKGNSPSLSLCHVSQGGPANKRSVSLLMKTDGVEMTLPIIKALEQVQLKIPMEEFLDKFMGVWGCDNRAILTKLMGLETQDEYELRTNEQMSEYTKEWMEEEVAYVDNKMTRFQILKAAQDGEELPLECRLELFNLRKQFEENYEDCKEDIEKSLEKEITVVEEGEEKEPVSKSTVEQNSDAVSEASNSNADNGITKTTEESNVTTENKTTDFTELMKSADFQALIKSQVAEATKEKDDQITELQKTAQTLQKAEQTRLNKSVTSLVKSYEFIAEDKQDSTVDFLLKSTDESRDMFVELMKSAKEAVDNAKAEVEAVKDEFGVVKSSAKQKEVKTSEDQLEKGLSSFAEAIQATEQ